MRKLYFFVLSFLLISTVHEISCSGEGSVIDDIETGAQDKQQDKKDVTFSAKSKFHEASSGQRERNVTQQTVSLITYLFGDDEQDAQAVSMTQHRAQWLDQRNDDPQDLLSKAQLLALDSKHLAEIAGKYKQGPHGILHHLYTHASITNHQAMVLSTLVEDHPTSLPTTSNVTPWPLDDVQTAYSDILRIALEKQGKNQGVLFDYALKSRQAGLIPKINTWSVIGASSSLMLLCCLPSLLVNITDSYELKKESLKAGVCIAGVGGLSYLISNACARIWNPWIDRLDRGSLQNSHERLAQFTQRCQQTNSDIDAANKFIELKSQLIKLEEQGERTENWLTEIKTQLQEQGALNAEKLSEIEDLLKALQEQGRLTSEDVTTLSNNFLKLTQVYECVAKGNKDHVDRLEAKIDSLVRANIK